MSRLSRLHLLLLSLVLIASVAGIASAQGGITVTANFNLRLRSGPGTGFPPLTTVPYTTALPTLARNAESSWVQVEYSGQRGWLSVDYLSVSGDISSLPVAGAEATAPGAGGVTAVNPLGLNFRTGPSVADSLITTLPPNTRLTLSGRSENARWVQTSYEGQVGWVAAWLLAIYGDVYTLPVGGVAAAPAAPAPSAPGLCDGMTLVSVNNDLDTALVLQLTGPDQAALTVPPGGNNRTCLQPGTYSYQASASNFTTMSGQRDFAASPGGDCYCWDWYETSAPATCRCSATATDYHRP